jgi:hypothetical protein
LIENYRKFLKMINLRTENVAKNILKKVIKDFIEIFGVESDFRVD